MGYIVKNVKIIIVDNLRIKMYFGIHFFVYRYDIGVLFFILSFIHRHISIFIFFTRTVI